MTTDPVRVGVIGGSGVYTMECLEKKESRSIETPFGVSENVVVASVKGIRCAFIPRHGPHHTLLPSEINYRANIFALKTLGVTHVIAINAVGSLRSAYKPGDVVVIDQLIDKTYQRASTFFGDGIVGHVAFGNPTCAALRQRVFEVVNAILPNTMVHNRGTHVTMEGPAFSTAAESQLNRQLGGDLIGMTTATEAKLAREAEMAFVSICMVTDHDAWEAHEHVDVAKVLHVLGTNSANAQIFTAAVVQAVGSDLPPSEAHQALQYSILTKKENIAPEKLRKMQPIFGKYLPPS